MNKIGLNCGPSHRGLCKCCYILLSKLRVLALDFKDNKPGFQVQKYLSFSACSNLSGVKVNLQYIILQNNCVFTM